MEQKLKELKEKDEEAFNEYFTFIKNSVNSGEYFRDSLDWYMLKYINPICDRVLMIFFAIIASVSLYFLIQIISSAFPLVEKIPVVIRDHDQSLYRPLIYSIKEKSDAGAINADEAVARYLIKNYIIERESFDFRKSEVGSINEKFIKIKNNSSFAEYKNYQLFMSKDNSSSPINFFGKNIFQETRIDSFSFIRSQYQNSYDRLKNFFSIKIPNEAEVKFTTITYKRDAEDNLISEKNHYLAKIRFNFAGIDKKAEPGVINFVVNEYKLFKVK